MFQAFADLRHRQGMTTNDDVVDRRKLVTEKKYSSAGPQSNRQFNQLPNIPLKDNLKYHLHESCKTKFDEDGRSPSNFCTSNALSGYKPTNIWYGVCLDKQLVHEKRFARVLSITWC